MSTPRDASDLAPFLMSEHEGTHSLLLTDFAGTEAVFERHGFDAGGYAWAGVADALVRLRAPHLEGKVSFDPEGSMFCAVSSDRAALEELGRLLSAATRDHTLLEEALEHADPDLMD